MSEKESDRGKRIEQLKSIIKRLHQGAAADEVKQELKRIVRETDASEIASMEQELIAEGMKVEEIQSMCDLHAQVLKEVLAEPAGVPVEPGHPVDTFLRENRALELTVSGMRSAVAEVAAADGDRVPDAALLAWKRAYNDLTDIDKHYQRKEYLLFTKLEKYGVSGPSQVMWGKHDEVRAMLKRLGSGLGEIGDIAAAKRLAEEVGEPLLSAVEEMIYKEEKILLPMALEKLSSEDWADIWRHSPEYGWCLVEPGEGYSPAEEAPAAEQATGIGTMQFPTGSLTAEQVEGILSALPVDITFVDADERVRFFSHGGDRIFSRSKAVLGRKVQHCHPPKSVDVVERILDDFRSGRRDVAEFWIELGGKFVHIRYFAVRTEDGRYLGTLEVTQDLSRLRALKGERRLLQYD
jgi:DUF438 domain-containing protein